MRHLLLMLMAIMACITSHAQSILSNGTFESNLVDWTTVTLNGSNAAFDVVTDPNYVHSGSKALRISVTNTGTAPNSVLLRHSPAGTPASRTYLIRFWALAGVQGAFLHVTARGATMIKECDFKIWNRINQSGTGWQQYQYLFIADEGTTTLDLTFNTSTVYYIDDVEIISDNDPVIDVAMQYHWQSNISGWGWVSGDNDVSVMLPDGRPAWVFNDSFYGLPSDKTNYLGGGNILNNLIVVEGPNDITGVALYSVFAGTKESPEPLFKPTSGGLYWIADAFVENNKLRVILTKWSGLDFAGETALAIVSLPDLSVESITVLPYTGFDIPNAVLTDNGYHYIYIAERPAGTFDRLTKVARVPQGQLNASTQWEFFAGNNNWSSDLSQAQTLVTGTEGATVIKLGEGSYAMSGIPNLSHDLSVWFAPSPTGPWTHKTIVYNIPQEEGVLPYLAHIHQWTENNGVYTLSYSVYPFDGGIPQQINDKGSYVPYYVKANLVALSPYGSGGGNSHPLVSITAPVNNTAYTVPVNIAISASASDSDGLVSSVSFYNGSTQLGTDDASPYVYDWNNVPAGNYIITARATDNEGATTVSAAVNIRVMENTVDDITDLGGTLTAQYYDSPTNEDISKLIDNNTQTKYLTFHNQGWVQFQANSTYVVTSYSITSANDAPERDPLSWTLQGSNNGSTWSTIDSRSNQDFPNRFQTKSFSFSNAVSYAHYRLAMSNNSGNILQLAELALYGVSGAVQDITDLSGTLAGQYYDSPVNEEIGKLIDNNINTKYLTFHASAWVQFQTNQRYIPSRYTITSANDGEGRDPLSWVFQGSNDGNSWVTLDSRNGQDFPARFQTREFAVNGADSYSHFRLSMSNNAGNELQLAEWEIFGVPSVAGNQVLNQHTDDLEAIVHALYPNPCNTDLTLEVSAEKSDRIALMLTDMSGQVRASDQQSLPSGHHTLNLDHIVAGLPKGIYFLKVSDSRSSRRYKLIKN